MSKYLELFTGSFDESIREKTKLENRPYIAYSVKDKTVVYTIIPNESGTMYTFYQVVKKDTPSVEYNAVDLGLPSGRLWADRNVGATSPEDSGAYFQWGGTTGYTLEMKKVLELTKEQKELFMSNPMFLLYYYLLIYNVFEELKEDIPEDLIIKYEDQLNGDEWTAMFAMACILSEFFGISFPPSDFEFDATLNWLVEYIKYLAPLLGDSMPELQNIETTHDLFNLFEFTIDDVFIKDTYFDYDSTNDTFIKYNNGDGVKVLETEDDTATQNMGSKWRIPTVEEFEELINNTNVIYIDTNNNEFTKEEVINGNMELSLKGIAFEKIEDNSSVKPRIFIPTAGNIGEFDRPSESYGVLLTSELDSIDSDPMHLMINKPWGNNDEYYHWPRVVSGSNGILDDWQRWCGFNVRGVEDSIKKYLTFKAEEDNSSIGLNALGSN